jgi:DNA-binding response OmpR family regulator
MSFSKFQMHSKLNVAIVEDDVDLLENMLDYLENSDFNVWGVGSAEAFYKKLLKESVDVVILDIGLPFEDGFSVAQYLIDFPEIVVIIVSARQDLKDRLKALDAGAERYLLKPVDMNELVANIKAATRGRFEKIADLSTSFWLLNPENWLLTSPQNKTMSLTHSEFLFLQALISECGSIVEKSALLAHFFPDALQKNNAADRLDALVARLRKKAQATFGEALPLKTITAVGYVFTSAAKMQ